MVGRLHLAVSVLAAAPFVGAPSPSTCENCAGTFCSYETSSAAGFGICYGTALTSDDCYSTYGALDVLYGGTPATPALKVAKIDPKATPTECDDVAKALVDANVMTFTKFATDTLSEVTTCAKCLETPADKNKWCQYKDGAKVLEGGYCALSTGNCVDLAATGIAGIAVDTVTAADKCPTTTTTTAGPTDGCTKCLAGTDKAYCGYTTGENKAKTPVYYACVSAGADCPVMAGINSIFAGLQDSTEVKSEKIVKGGDCTAFKSLTANLDLDATPANTDKKTCGECVKAENAKWCNYVSKTSDKKDGPTGGYCGVKSTCAVFTETFNKATITNEPAKPQDKCDFDSSAFGLSSAATLAVAATCAAATVLA